MEKQDPAVIRLLQRRLATVKIAVRMLQNELDLAGEARITMDRALVESLATSIEVFVEDLESDTGVPKGVITPHHATNGGGERRTTLVPDKPLQRLN